MPAKSSPQSLLEQLQNQIAKAKSGWAFAPKDYPAALAIANLPPPDRPAMLDSILHAMLDTYHARLSLRYVDPNKLNAETRNFITVNLLATLVTKLLRVQLPLSSDQIDLLTACGLLGGAGQLLNLSTLIRTVEQFAADHPVSERSKKNLQRLRVSINSAYNRHTHTKEFARFMERLDMLQSSQPPDQPEPIDTGPDRPTAGQQRLVDAFMHEVAAREHRFTRDPADFKTGTAIIDLPVEDRPAMLRCVLAALHSRAAAPGKDYMLILLLRALVSRLLRAALPLTDADLLQLLARTNEGFHPLESISVPMLLRALEQRAARTPLPSSVRLQLQTLQAKLRKIAASSFNGEPSREIAGQLARLDLLLGMTRAPVHAPKPLDAGEPWAAAAQRDIDALAPAPKQHWDALLHHLQSADGAKPSQKWIKQAQALIDAFGRDRVRTFLAAWLPLTPKNRDTPPANMRHLEENLLFTDASQLTLKGLAWAASTYQEPEVATALGDLGETCWKKIPNIGPRSKLVGNAVLWALSAIGTNHAVAQLTRINSKLKHASARALADKAMNRVAEKTGRTRDDLEELAVPTFGLDQRGAFTRTLGDFTATVSITPELDVDLSITDSAGKTRKSVPADLKASPDFKALQKSIKELRSLLPAQRLRIESILRNPDRSWSFADWRARYLDHPLIARLARRLIWRFTTGGQSTTAMFHDGQFLRAAGSPLPTPDNQSTVKLWHPCTDTPGAVRAWRAFLEQHQITQPFKQAHREIYLLTDAERTTDTYSNRFAAHIIRQHQFNALCAQRGWKYRLQGAWDGGDATPTLELPALNLKIEFWVQQIGGGGDEPFAASGVSLNLSTDQVRFYRWQPVTLTRTQRHQQFLEQLERIGNARAAGQPPQPLADLDESAGQLLSLAQVPPQVFSEIMRDVDLFVGVCSVGNDPTWQDGGPDGRFRDYWQSYSFGDLNETANTRKAVLETLVPRLSIAAQCTLADKFLIIRGKLRTYKIHLGSANILMEPNDQYLCIVPGQSSKARTDTNLFLPFEGDNTLAVILSKAFLLASDTKITDPTITRQIRP